MNKASELSKRNTLLARFLEVVCFLTCSHVKVEVGHNPSIIWKSLVWSRSLMMADTRWREGRAGKILTLKLIIRFLKKLILKSFTPYVIALELIKVSDLINHTMAHGTKIWCLVIFISLMLRRSWQCLYLLCKLLKVGCLLWKVLIGFVGNSDMCHLISLQLLHQEHILNTVDYQKLFRRLQHHPGLPCECGE